MNETRHHRKRIEREARRAATASRIAARPQHPSLAQRVNAWTGPKGPKPLNREQAQSMFHGAAGDALRRDMHPRFGALKKSGAASRQRPAKWGL